MPRVRCPKCENTTRVPDDYNRSHIHCTECSFKIHVNQNLVSGESGKEKKKKVRRERPLDERFAWIPVLVVCPLAIVLVPMSFRFDFAGTFMLVLALSILIGGVVWGALFAWRDGAYVGFDWMDSSALRLILMACGPYWLGYIVYLQFLQIQYGLRRPKKYLPLLVLEMTGLLMLCTCPFGFIARQREEARRFADAMNNPQPKNDGTGKSSYAAGPDG